VRKQSRYDRRPTCRGLREIAVDRKVELSRGC
jgi:hypothetical protein